MRIPPFVAALVKLGARLGDSTMPMVTHHATTGRTSRGVTHTLVDLPALVEDGGSPLRLPDGTDVVPQAKLTFLEPVVVTETDRFTVNDRESGVLRFLSPLDGNGEPYMTEVWLGAPGVTRT